MLPLRDMRSVLYATAILFAVAAIGVRGAFLWTEYRSAITRAQAAAHDLALLLEEYSKRTLETSDLLLSEIIAYVRLRGGVGAVSETGDANRHLAELAQKTATNDLFLITDRDGNVIAISIPPPASPINLADREWFQVHHAGVDTFVGSAITGRLSNSLRYTYSRRIPDLKGEFDGTVQVALEPAFLQAVSRLDRSTTNVILGIWKSDGRIIARTGLSPAQINTRIRHPILFDDLKAEPSGVYRTNETADGVERIVAFRRLEQWPVIVTASIPVSTALAAWTAGLYWSAIITAIILIAFGWLTWFGVKLSYQMEETQHQLQHANEDLAKALADKVMLLQEIHHRVKNNLQVTSSLLQMQSRRFEDERVKAAFQETQDRLRSIGLIHDILYRKETGGMIDLREYLSRLIEELSAAYGASERGIAVDLDAQPITIDIERGAPLALAVTEAISNAFKHAFGPDQGGRISVSTRQPDDKIEVVVRDTGKGLSSMAEKETSLGMKLIRSFVRQLDGTFSLESDGGTTFRMQIPA